MGGAVSTGQDNDDLIDNLLAADYIKSSMVERVFRAVDRGEYFLAKSRVNAYKDLAWKSGHLHISAPCIYSEVMEGLELKPGLSFLNLGSGTGYLSTMVGLILGSSGINRGIELHEDVVQYANKKLADFKRLSGAIDEYDFCEPHFVQGNCLCLINSGYKLYDRVYCGAAVPSKYENYVKNLLKVGGILVMPLNDELLQIKRVSENRWDTKKLLPVSFATLIVPLPEEPQFIDNFELQPPSLQCLCRTVVRNILRKNIEVEHPPVKRTIPPTNKAPKKKRALKKIVVPLFDSDTSEDEHVITLGRDRNAGRAMVAGLEAERAMNFVFGGGHGVRRGFLRSHRRPPQNLFCVCLQNNNNNNVSSSDANKTDESEPMEVEFEGGEQQTNDVTNSEKPVEEKNTTSLDNCKGTENLGEQSDEREKDNTVVEHMEEDNNGMNGRQENTEENTNSTENCHEKRDSKPESKTLDEAHHDSSNSSLNESGQPFFSVIHMPRSLVINGVVITNIQTFDSSNEGPSVEQGNKMDGVIIDRNNSEKETDNSGSQDNSKASQTTTQAEVNASEATRNNPFDSDSELLCNKCDEAREGSSCSNKGKEPQKAGGNRKKFDSGLGDEIVESNMVEMCSDFECDNDKSHHSSSSENKVTEDKDKDDDTKSDESQSLRWIDLDGNMTPLESSTDDENDESKGNSDDHTYQNIEEYHMYQSPYTAYIKCKIQKLPLPIMLKNFLNYNRDF